MIITPLLKPPEKTRLDSGVAEKTFGVKGMYVGVPTVIGAGGVERIVNIKLNKEEQEMFDTSVKAVQGLVDACKGIDESLG